MLASSRTPEGESNRCPICGASVCIEPSWPFGDAPCPRCGHLLMFDDAISELSPPAIVEPTPVGVSSHWAYAYEETAAISPRHPLPPRTSSCRDDDSKRITRIATTFCWIWAATALFAAFWILIVDCSLPILAAWIVAASFYLCCIPGIVRWAERNTLEASWRGMLRLIVGYWGLLFGPMLGSAIGSMTAPMTDYRWTALQGAVYGFVVGSLEAIVVMTLLMSLLLGILSCRPWLTYVRHYWSRRAAQY